jgi:hypothetical protein
MRVLLNMPPWMGMAVFFLPEASPVLEFYGYQFLKFAKCEVVIQRLRRIVDKSLIFLGTISEGVGF